MSTNIDQSLDDIIKLKQKKQAPRGKGAVTGAGGVRKTKQQLVQKQVIRQKQQQKRSKLSIPKGRQTRQGQRGRNQATGAAVGKRLSSTPTPRQSAVSARGRGGRGRGGGIAARLQRIQQANSQRVPVASKRRRGALSARIGRGGRVAKTRVNQAALSAKNALATIQANKQAGRTPQTRASGPVDSSPSSEFSSPMNLLISVGDSGYSRQVDTEPVGIDIGAIPVHTTSQTLNSRFTAIEELAMGNRSPIPQPQSDTGGSFNRKLRIVGRGRGRGESVMGQGGRGRGRGRR